ncbi:hypothetical protein [Nocardioides sp. 1609]|uniref:hypothetical protein n=1 Tax=Nocardioides sp. 1609 TaxID=2508327 RepID=UPI00106F6C63|nr:hypothetical protein [Nocardioides sp. 1609]
MSQFAALTAAVIICTIPPLLFMWGIPDTLTFDHLRGRPREGENEFASAIAATSLLTLPAVGVAAALALRADFDPHLVGSICVLVVAAMFNSVLQGCELATENLDQVARFVLALGAATLFSTLLALLLTAPTAEGVLTARAVATATVTVWRALATIKGASLVALSLDSIGHMLRRGTHIHVTALLAAGGYRLEQAFALELFNEAQLSLYGLAMPVVAGVKVVQYGLGTTTAIGLAKSGFTGLGRAFSQTLRLVPVSLLFGAVGCVAITAYIHWILPDSRQSIAPVCALILSGVMLGILDVAVRCMRAVGAVGEGILGRLIALAVTVTIGPLLYARGLLDSAAVGVVATILALSGMILMANVVTRRWVES